MLDHDDKSSRNEVILTTAGAADMLGVAVSTVQKWVESGELDSWKTPGGHRRIPMAGVVKLLRQRGDRPEAETPPLTLMQRPDGMQDEHARVAATMATGLFTAPDRDAFDSLVRLAGQVTGAPIAAFTLLTSEHQILRSRIGIDVRETPRDWAFCNHTVLGEELLCVEDASRDPRFCANPLVSCADGIRFYAGVPVHDRRGYRIGALCVLDREPRRLSTEQE
ncbi:MAG: GAF domain-containing protein, partial [Massilia sp.]